MKVIIIREDQQEIEAHTLLDPTRKATTVVVGDALYLLRPDYKVRWWPSMKTPAKNYMLGQWRLAQDPVPSES